MNDKLVNNIGVVVLVMAMTAGLLGVWDAMRSDKKKKNKKIRCAMCTASLCFCEPGGKRVVENNNSGALRARLGRNHG